MNRYTIRINPAIIEQRTRYHFRVADRRLITLGAWCMRHKQHDRLGFELYCIRSGIATGGTLAPDEWGRLAREWEQEQRTIQQMKDARDLRATQQDALY